MYNSNNNLNNLQKKNNNEYEEEYEFIHVNAATGDQYKKTSSIRSENGQITPEMVRKFHNDSTKEVRQWKKDNPRVRSVTFIDLKDENGKQVIKLIPMGDLIFPLEHRVKIYDESGNQIIGEENIRREIEKREAEWEQWEREGKLQVVDHQTHTFNDGSFANIYFQIPPVKRLHEREVSEITESWGNLNKRLKGNQEEQNLGKNHDNVEQNSKIKGRITENDSSQGSQADFGRETQTASGSITTQLGSFRRLTPAQVIQSVINNPQDWKIEKLVLSLKEGKEESVLVHKSVSVNQLTYDENNNLKVDSKPVYRYGTYGQDGIRRINDVLNQNKESTVQGVKERDNDSSSKGLMATVVSVGSLAVVGIGVAIKKLGGNKK